MSKETKEQRKQRYMRNKAKAQQQSKEYYASHQDYYKKYMHDYFLHNPQDPAKRYIAQRKYRITHREKDRAYAKSYYKTHKQQRQEYIKNNPEIRKKKHRTRRAKQASVQERYYAKDERFTKALFNNQCFNCASTTKLVIDHVYPLSLGYPLSRANACVLCNTCNIKKSNLLPQYFYSLEKLTELKALLMPQQLLLPFNAHSAFVEACDSLTSSCL